MKPNVPLGFALIFVGGSIWFAFADTTKNSTQAVERNPVEPIAKSTDASASVMNTSTRSKNETKRTIREMIVTAYCTCKVCCEGWSAYKKTSIGDDATVCDGVAAAPKLLPYRTKLNIPGIGIREVDDTGGAMRQDARKGIYHIDVRMASHKEALKWGRKKLLVEVMR